MHALVSHPIPNLLGDRDIENSWVAGQLSWGPGIALDFGCGHNYLGLMASCRGYEVTAIDLEEIVWPYSHPNLKFVQGDILRMNWEPCQFDLIINCSAIEHVGIKGRYGSRDARDGDLEAMSKLHELLKPEGTMLLTIPIGEDAVISPYHRVYGPARLPLLLTNYHIYSEEFYVKDKNNCWQLDTKENAFKTVPSRFLYSLGLFVLKA